uniref:tRNA (32-2'-O)-methyltransferase regulator THADA n=1 Tax=Culicoides sonorensis TaxID=179676 RepID=A0A336KPM1_CULSO
MNLTIKVVKSSKTEPFHKKVDWKQETLKLEIIEIPEDKRPMKNLTPEIQPFIQEFSKCDTVEKQLKFIRETYRNDLCDDMKVKYLELFCKIYFQTPWKHPIKNCLSKIIDRETKFTNESKEFLKCDILNSIERYDFQSKIPLSETREIIGNIGALLENFKCGTIAFHENLETILDGFSHTLGWYRRALRRENVSPATKSELCVSIHNLIKIVIHAVQLFADTINWDGFIQENMWNMGCVMDSDDIPIDTKANIGIVCAVFSKGMKINPFEEFKSNKITVGKLCTTFGVITNLNNAYLEQYPDILEEIYKTINGAIDSNPHDALMALFIARTISQLAKRLEMLPVNELTEKISFTCLNYGIKCLDHNLDSVKNTSKEIIQNLIVVGQKKHPKILDHIFNLIENHETDKRHKSVIISCICQVSGSKFVCEKIPNVRTFLLNSLENNNSHNSNSESILCYEMLITSQLNSGKMDPKTFYNEYIKMILLKFIEIDGDGFELKKSLTKLLNRAIKKFPEIIDLILKEENIPIQLRLSCLGAAKKSGTFNNRTSDSEKWKLMLEFNEIRNAMVTNDEQIRLAAFELIIEVHRLTEQFTEAEFDCILYFLRHNVNSEVPAIRSQIIGHMRNCLYRVENSLNFFKRKPDETKMCFYNKFIEELATFCFENFFKGANFGRRTISLKILLQLCETLDTSCATHLKQRIWSVQRFEIILNLCNDTYESNKSDAVALLKYCPKELMHCRDVNLNIVNNMIQNCKPMSSLTGAYYLEFLVFVYMDQENLDMLNDIQIACNSSNTSLVLKIVLWLEKSLQKSYEIASKSLFKASYQCPMYGELFAIRHLLSKIELKRDDPVINDWRSFFERLIPFCSKLTDVAAPIVNNSSPEGHLPNDFSSIKSYANGSCDPNDDEILSKVTPQMILLCAWRTVKEVSLLLGDISYKAPLIEDNSPGYISIEQILNIGTHFTTLLSETKHRGAFEQSYVGFSRLCIRLWSCGALELHSLPMRWLKALIKIISGEKITTDGLDMSVEKLCATRRSAGIPFLMQALLTAELQVGTTCSALKFCMENLLQIAKSESGESRTHSLNILRALYRCTELSQVITQYISDGFMTAIQAYNADTWAERNSATLLFSALMLRVFGVQRHRDSDQLNIRNKMTGRSFFQKYPNLYDFFYKILVTSQKISSKGRRFRKLHSLLLLISRLYPSSWEEAESNLLLTKFIPLISGCTANPELKTRQLAAKIIPIIIQPDQIIARTMKLINICLTSDLSKIKVNSYHGALLETLYLIKSINIEKISDEQKSSLTNAWQNIQNNIYDIRFIHIPVIASTFCDILLEIFIRISSNITFKDGFSSVIESIFKENYDIPGLGHDIMMRKFGIYNFLVNFVKEEIEIEKFFVELQSDNYGYDYEESILNILILVTDPQCIRSVDLNLEISDLEIKIAMKIVQMWDVNRNEIINKILCSNSMAGFLINTIKTEKYHQCTMKAFLMISRSTFFLEKFMTHLGITGYQSLFALADSNQFQESIYACIERYFKELWSSDEEINMEVVIQMVEPNQSDKVKLTAIKILKEVFTRFDFGSSECNVNFISTCIWSLLILLRDDEMEVRDASSKLVMEIYNKFYNVNENENILASLASENLFILLKDVIIKQKYTNHEASAIYVKILCLDKEILETDDQNITEIDDVNQCFDKNESNLFGENHYIQNECKRWKDFWISEGNQNSLKN